MIVGKDGVHMDDSKVKVILEWPKPKNVKELEVSLDLLISTTDSSPALYKLHGYSMTL